MSSVIRHDHPDPGSVPVLDAATVMLVRDGEDGLEVCLMQRNLNSDFVGGAFVFPGGAVDPEDRLPEAAELCAGLTDEHASRLLGEERGGLAFWIAVVREAFEEAGVLLARWEDGRPVMFDTDELVARFAAHRAEVDAGRRTLVEVCRAEGVRLDAGGIHHFSRWITPVGAPRRYDTRFFVAAAPELQEVTHDDRELIGTHWLTPGEALRRQEEGEIVLIFPTVRSLIALDRFERAADVLDHARRLAEVPAVLPTIVESDDGTRIVLPGDPEHTGGVYDAFTARPVDD